MTKWKILKNWHNTYITYIIIKRYKYIMCVYILCIYIYVLCIIYIMYNIMYIYYVFVAFNNNNDNKYKEIMISNCK